MKPMMKPTNKRLKFKAGDEVPGFDTDDRRALLERARRYIAARGEGNEMSPAQEAMLRQQAGREYGLRGEEPARSAARPAPANARPNQAATRPRVMTSDMLDEEAGIVGRAARRSAMEQAQEQEGADMGKAMQMLAARENVRAAIDSGNNAPRSRSARSEPQVVRPPDYERQIRAQALEPSYPLESMIGGGGLRVAAEGARALARRGANAAEETAAKVFSRPQARQTTTYDPAASRAFVEAGTKRAAEERARQAARADQYRALQERRKAAAEARKTRETSRMEGEGMGTVKARGNPKNKPPGPRDKDELRMSGEGMGFKRGGTAKFAKGGAVSARADGIAQRGKTKGKLI